MDIAIEKKKGFKKKHIPYVLGALLLAFVVWLIASDHSSTLKVDSRSVTIGKAEKGPFKDYIRINAQVQPMTTIHLSTTEGGVVEMRNVEEGAVVRKGDVIVTLSNSTMIVIGRTDDTDSLIFSFRILFILDPLLRDKINLDYYII